MSKQKPTEKEIRDTTDDAIAAECNAMEEGSRYPGMTYEQGVAAAMRWGQWRHPRSPAGGLMSIRRLRIDRRRK